MKKRDEKYNMIWEIEKVFKDNDSGKKKLRKIGYIIDKYEGFDVGDPPE